MPELPEVETVRRQLVRLVKGERIAEARILHPKLVRPLKPAAFEKLVSGARFADFKRRAKVLQMDLSNGRTVLVHLKMTGRMLIEKKGTAPRKETEAVFRFPDGRQLFYDDLRRFGWMKVLATEDVPKYFEKEGYGPEPLDPSFDARKFALCLRGRRSGRIKQVLMDQTCLAGVGNIYADESLWDSGILPTRQVNGLSDEEISALFRSIRTVLKRAIVHRGSSPDAYRDLFGREGEHQRYLRAYGQEGKSCARHDGGIIKKAKLGGRGTHWCPVHQK